VERDVAPNHCWCQKTRVFLLPHSEDRVILPSFVIGYQRVTDRQTDRRTDVIAVVITAVWRIENPKLYYKYNLKVKELCQSAAARPCPAVNRLSGEADAL